MTKAAEPVAHVHVSFNPDQPHTEADRVQQYNLIVKARNLGVTTQGLPPIPGEPPSAQFAHAGIAPVPPTVEGGDEHWTAKAQEERKPASAAERIAVKRKALEVAKRYGSSGKGGRTRAPTPSGGADGEKRDSCSGA